MDIERTVDDIEQLEEMFDAPDIRPLNATDPAALNRRHDEVLALSPWFQIWLRYGVCCRVESLQGFNWGNRKLDFPQPVPRNEPCRAVAKLVLESVIPGTMI
jgi:hypothetical protein